MCPFVRFEEPTKEDKKKAARERSEWIESRARLLRRAKRAPLILAPSRLEVGGLGPGRGIEAPAASGTRALVSRDRTLLFGQAFHRIMELAGLPRARPLNTLAAAVAKGLGIADEAADLERIAAVALASELLARAARSTRSYREVPFTVHRDGGFIEGRIDLLFEDNGAWTLVDYKTDDLAPAYVDERLGTYRPQAAVYALALKSLGMELRGGMVLYFVRPNITRTIEFSASLEKEADSLIRAAMLTPPTG